MRWPCTCRMRLSAKPPVMACLTLPMSAPPRSHSSRASATAPMVMPTIIWLASLASWPAPVGPTCVARPSTSKAGRARSKSAGLPPAMIAKVPASAPTVPPETGASRCCTPMAARRAAWSRAWRGWIEDMSTTRLPGRRPSAVPCRNSTSSTARPSSSRVMTRSAAATACAGVSCTWAPKGCRRSALARERFQAWTVNPLRTGGGPWGGPSCRCRARRGWGVGWGGSRQQTASGVRGRSV